MGLEDLDQPDVVMWDVDYVRVRSGDPTVRFRAEMAERWEERQTMELRNFSFEQFDNHGNDINATGQAGAASVELDTGNIRLDGGVRIAVESEDLIIETGGLTWQDKERILAAGAADQVEIQRSDGTNFSGWGFTANTRNRTWEFSDGVVGIYVHEDNEEGSEEGGRQR